MCSFLVSFFVWFFVIPSKISGNAVRLQANRSGNSEQRFSQRPLVIKDLFATDFFHLATVEHAISPSFLSMKAFLPRSSYLDHTRLTATKNKIDPLSFV